VTDRTLEAVAIACIKECERQRVGLDRLGRLIEGVAYAIEHSMQPPQEGDILHLAGLVEPSSGGQYRSTPVTFISGGDATDWYNVPGATARLMAYADHRADPDEVVRAFLNIHPFSDGNGRVAFILLNWLRGTLHDPSPLPDLFGESDN
jgi:Fic/DOC family